MPTCQFVIKINFVYIKSRQDASGLKMITFTRCCNLTKAKKDTHVPSH